MGILLVSFLASEEAERMSAIESRGNRRNESLDGK